MKILYLDCFSGISGDMTMGALLDAGGDAEALKRDLAKLGLGDAFHLHIHKALKNGVMCTHVDVATDYVHGDHEHDHGHEHVHRGLHDVLAVIDGSTLEEEVKETARRIFRTLAEAEAKMHGTTVDEVHFHEVGAIDAIVDVVGAAILVHQLKPDRILCSRINVGSGYVQCAHGLFPVPAPAVAEILRGKPWFMGPGRGELCTPTGAAIAATLSEEFGRMPVFEVDAIGYGAGQREMETLNALRVIVGHESKKA